MFKQLLEKVESIDVYTSVSEQIMVAKSSEELKLLLKFSPDEKYKLPEELVNICCLIILTVCDIFMQSHPGEICCSI